MTASHSFWLVPLAGAALMVGGGCGSPDNNFSPVAGVDASHLDRGVADLAPPVDRASDAVGAMADGTDGTAGTDGTLGADVADDAPGGNGDAPAPATFKMTVDVDSPMAGGIAIAQNRFVPVAIVTVASSMPSATDLVQEVTATLVQSQTKMQFGSVKLTQAKVETLPESTTVVYRFGDTPMDLTQQISGTFDMVVTAKSVGGAQAEGRITFQIDAGPSIRIDSPLAAKSYRGSAPVDISISDAVFGPVSEVTMTLGQRPVKFMGPGGTSGTQYTATIDFSGFDVPLEGDQLLTVRAKNKNGTVSSLTRKFISDSKGPTIANTSPKVGDLVGKVVSISAEITDPAGVLDSSVVVVIAHGDMTYQRKLDPPPAGSTDRTYRTLFDTSNILGSNALFPSISFRASDVLGNESSIGYLLSFDNTPPVADLDPPDDFRSLMPETDGTLKCSWKFDPVGPDAVDDGDLVAQLFDVRARIEDQGNAPSSGGADFTPIAGVEEGKAQLLVLDDVSSPLVVDTNGDGVCDAVNPFLKPTTTPMSSTDALLINMTPIPVGGSPDMTLDPNANCNAGLTGATLPLPSCSSTENLSKSQAGGHSYYMTGYIPYTTGRTPAIWTVPPIVEDTVQCTGRQFDASSNNIKDGWACLAVVATDRLGNGQVSRPLRVCVDHDGKGGECPHKRLATVTSTNPMVVETELPHGYSTGDVVVIRAVVGQVDANGTWTITVQDATHFSLGGPPGIPGARVSGGGWVVLQSLIPDCTGTQTVKGPPPVVTSKPCLPWRLFPRGERRRF